MLSRLLVILGLLLALGSLFLYSGSGLSCLVASESGGSGGPSPQTNADDPDNSAEEFAEDDQVEPVVAYLLDDPQRWNQGLGARALLEEAGFDVRPLPLDRAPTELNGMIFFASFVSERPEYVAYTSDYAAALRRFVRRGNLLVQMAQSARAEAEPPFLESELDARRSPAAFAPGIEEGFPEMSEEVDAATEEYRPTYVITAGTRLLEGVPVSDGRLAVLEQPGGALSACEPFIDHFGFEVILAGDPSARYPALMQANNGRGRIILSALPLDHFAERSASLAEPVAEESQEEQPSTRPAEDESEVPLDRAFAKNLYAHAVDVRRGKAQRLRMTPPSQSSGFVRGSWALAVLPDTQFYSERYPGTFHLQTEWIARNVGPRDIRYVLHLGDMVNTNSRLEWSRARAAMARLDGVVPYAIAIGNHDYGPGGDASTRDSLLNEYFSLEALSAYPGFGGAMEPGKLDNTFHLFEAGGRRWIIIALEWGPRDETIAWANSVMEAHPDHVGILITHAYLNDDGRRYDRAAPEVGASPEPLQKYNPHEYETPGGVNDGEELWQKLVRHHNFALVLNGHVLGKGSGYLGSRNDTGTTTHQILSNYQMRHDGGGGFLRLMEFLPDGQTVRVRTYSPLYDQYLMEPGHHFMFQLDQPPVPRARRAGASN